MTIKRKIKSQSGFSLAETLLAVLILLLVSVIVANGIPVARNVYNKVIVGANAQVLLSTTVTALRNELGTARDISIDDTNKTIQYYKSSISAYSRLSTDDAKGIQVLDYVNKDTGAPIPVAGAAADDRTAHNLVSNAAANKNLIVTYDGTPTQSRDVICIPDIQVKDGTGAVLVEMDELKIRLVPVPESET